MSYYLTALTKLFLKQAIFCFGVLEKLFWDHAARPVLEKDTERRENAVIQPETDGLNKHPLKVGLARRISGSAF